MYKKTCLWRAKNCRSRSITIIVVVLRSVVRTNYKPLTYYLGFIYVKKKIYVFMGWFQKEVDN